MNKKQIDDNIILLKNNKYHKGLIPLENLVSLSDVDSRDYFTKETSEERETSLVTIESQKEPKALYIVANCSEKEEDKFIHLF